MKGPRNHQFMSTGIRAARRQGLPAPSRPGEVARARPPYVAVSRPAGDPPRPLSGTPYGKSFCIIVVRRHGGDAVRAADEKWQDVYERVYVYTYLWRKVLVVFAWLSSTTGRAAKGEQKKNSENTVSEKASRLVIYGLPLILVRYGSGHDRCAARRKNARTTNTRFSGPYWSNENNVFY